MLFISEKVRNTLQKDVDIVLESTKINLFQEFANIFGNQTAWQYFFEGLLRDLLKIKLETLNKFEETLPKVAIKIKENHCLNLLDLPDTVIAYTMQFLHFKSVLKCEILCHQIFQTIRQNNNIAFSNFEIYFPCTMIATENPLNKLVSYPNLTLYNQTHCKNWHRFQKVTSLKIYHLRNNYKNSGGNSASNNVQVLSEFSIFENIKTLSITPSVIEQMQISLYYFFYVVFFVLHVNNKKKQAK